MTIKKVIYFGVINCEDVCASDPLKYQLAKLMHLNAISPSTTLKKILTFFSDTRKRVANELLPVKKIQPVPLTKDYLKNADLGFTNNFIIQTQANRH